MQDDIVETDEEFDSNLQEMIDKQLNNLFSEDSGTKLFACDTPFFKDISTFKILTN